MFCDPSVLCCDDSKLRLLLGAGGLLQVDVVAGHAERKRSDVFGARSDGDVAALNDVDLEQAHVSQRHRLFCHSSCLTPATQK